MRKRFCVFVTCMLCFTAMYSQDAGIYESGIILGGTGYTESSPGSSINNAAIIKNAGQQLNLTSAYVKTFKKKGASNVCSGYFFYRVYAQNSTPPSFSGVTCSSLSNLNSSEGLQNQEWFNNTINIDLINGLAEGDYILDLYYGANITAGSAGCSDGPSAFIQNLQAKITITSPLNASFSGFTTSSDNEYVYLKWELADSSDVQYFTVEKSDNGVQWKTLATILPNTNLSRYFYIDSLPQTGLNFYRVKATAGDKTIYSISRRNYVGLVDNIVTVYPNPVKQNLRFEMSALIQGRYRALVFSSAGIKIAEKFIDHDGKDKYITIPLPPLASRGVYWVVLMTKNEFYKQNFLVQ